MLSFLKETRLFKVIRMIFSHTFQTCSKTRKTFVAFILQPNTSFAWKINLLATFMCVFRYQVQASLDNLKTLTLFLRLSSDRARDKDQVAPSKSITCQTFVSIAPYN